METLAVMKRILVDRFIYGGFVVTGGDTPHRHQTVTNQLQPG
jgi:hypothetical protein